MTNFIQMPVCNQCGHIQYPEREICKKCLSDQIATQDVDATGTVIAKVTLAHSLDTLFKGNLPWPIASILLNSNVSIIAHLKSDDLQANDPVKIQQITDPKGRSVLVAVPMDQTIDSWDELIEGRNYGE